MSCFKKLQLVNELRWLYCCLILLCISCNTQNGKIHFNENNVDSLYASKHLNRKVEAIVALKKMIQSSDVITRTGNDFTSQCLKSLNRNDKTFSHCGIASIENDTLFVYHAIGGEYNPTETIRKDLFENFCSPNENNAVGIFRFKISNSIKLKLIEIAKELHRKKITFDLDFDLQTDYKMYCSEFVYKSFLHASDSAVRFSHSFIRQFEFIGVDDISTNKLSTKIALLNFNKL